MINFHKRTMAFTMWVRVGTSSGSDKILANSRQKIAVITRYTLLFGRLYESETMRSSISENGKRQLPGNLMAELKLRDDAA
jgi:hypothetical protein